MEFDVHARLPHYRRHLTPIVAELLLRGNTQTAGAPVVLVAGRNDAWRLGQQGRRVVLVEHGAGQTYIHEGQHIDASGLPPDPRVILYLAPRQETAEFMAQQLPNARCVVVGSPALEALTSRFNHRYATDEWAGFVTFAVHWQSGLPVKEAQTSWPWSLEIVKILVGACGDRLRVTAHPRILSRIRHQLHRKNIEVDYGDDWDDLASDTGLLICDNSSIIWEADALGIPVILMDPPGWRPDAPHGLRWGPEASRFLRISEPTQTVELLARTWAGGVPPGSPVYELIDGATDAAADAIEALT